MKPQLAPFTGSLFPASLPALLVAGLMLAAAPARGQMWPIGNLAGIRALQVDVPQLSRPASRAGLREIGLKADMELRMRHEGLFFGRSRNDPLRPAPVLQFTIQVQPREVGTSTFYTFRMELALMQNVALMRAPWITSTLPTWIACIEGTDINSNMVRAVRLGLTDLLNRFFDERRVADSQPIDPYHNTAVAPDVTLPPPPLPLPVPEDIQ